jgi:hypothetical protein
MYSVLLTAADIWFLSENWLRRKLFVVLAVDEYRTKPTCTLFEPIVKLLITEFTKLRTAIQLLHDVSPLQMDRALSTMKTTSARANRHGTATGHV